MWPQVSVILLWCPPGIALSRGLSWQLPVPSLLWLPACWEESLRLIMLQSQPQCRSSTLVTGAQGGCSSAALSTAGPAPAHVSCQLYATPVCNPAQLGWGGKADYSLLCILCYTACFLLCMAIRLLCRCPCSLQGNWTRWPLRVPFNSKYSMIVSLSPRHGADHRDLELRSHCWHLCYHEAFMVLWEQQGSIVLVPKYRHFLHQANIVMES